MTKGPSTIVKDALSQIPFPLVSIKSSPKSYWPLPNSSNQSSSPSHITVVLSLSSVIKPQSTKSSPLVSSG